MPNSTCYKVVAAGTIVAGIPIVPHRSKQWVGNQGLTSKYYALNGHTEGPRLFVYADLRDAQEELRALGVVGYLILRCKCGPLTRLPHGEVWRDHMGQKRVGDSILPAAYQWLLEGSAIPEKAFITDWVVPVEEIHHAKH